jgi:phthiocerol/phenolphthiocerol synthesis type-I polyketide synthase E
MTKNAAYHDDPVTATLTSTSSAYKVEGRYDIQTRLARLWQGLLGVQSVGFNDNYFEMGGDSILAVQLFVEIEKQFKIKLPVATLYDAPTIAELARIVRGEVTTSGWSPLVAIQPMGARPPFYCVHGAGGNVLIYRDLARHLGSDQPFYGLQSQGLDGTCEPLTTVEEMAALYIREIKSLQARGPYYLGGYCGGGTIALEMAQQLLNEGDDVALLALLDTCNWGKVPLPSFWTKAYHASEKLTFHVANFLDLDANGKSQFLCAKAQALRSRVPVWKGKLLRRRRSVEVASQARLLARIWQANDEACLRYVAKPYSGVITDLRPRRQYRMLDRTDVKWGQLARGGQHVVVLPVYPAGMLVEPYVRHLAAALEKSIGCAVRRQTARIGPISAE